MNDTNLASHHCVPCEGGTKPLTPDEYQVYHEQVSDWQIIDEKMLKKEFTLKNFKAAIGFINHMADIAESEGHHPDFILHNYKKVTVTLMTHAIGGLSINDFVMAMKINQIEV